MIVIVDLLNSTFSAEHYISEAIPRTHIQTTLAEIFAQWISLLCFAPFHIVLRREQLSLKGFAGMVVIGMDSLC